MFRALALLCTIAAVAAGQDDIIRIDTRLVEVDVVVRDSHGPVGGLTGDDFAVYDNGKRQTISAFSVRSGRVSTNVEPLPAGAVSNRLNARGEEPAQATVILWDMLNTEVEDQSWVRGQVLGYLSKLAPEDRVALYALVKGLRVVEDFTDDPDVLRAAVARTTAQQSVNLSAVSLSDLAGTGTLVGPDDGGAAAQAMQEINQMQKTAALEMTWYNQRDRSLITLAALRATADHLRGLPGRKKLIWVSGSFPALTMQQNDRAGATQIETLNVGFQIQKAIEDLNEANVAVYPIDPRGITTGINASSATLDVAGRAGLTNTGLDTMNLIAGGTGGRAFYATNDMTKAMTEVFADFDVVYSLAFYPSDDKLDGDYHRLSVKVDRKGVNVHHRKGYFASDVKVATQLDRQNALNAAMRNELEATGVGIIAAAKPDEETPGLIDIDLTVDAHDLHFQQIEGRWLSGIEFATHFSEIPTMSGTDEGILINLTEEKFRDAMTNGFKFRRQVDAGGQAGELRIAIQDRASGKTGTVSVPIPKVIVLPVDSSGSQDAAPRQNPEQ